MNNSLQKLGWRLSQRSGHSWARHASLVMRGGNIIAVGVNHEAVHAEFAALNSLWPSERRGVTVISLRFTKTGQLANARPCPKCARYMIDNGVKCVKFSTTGGKMDKIKLAQGIDYTNSRYPNLSMDSLPPAYSGAAYYGKAPFIFGD